VMKSKNLQRHLRFTKPKQQPNMSKIITNMGATRINTNFLSLSTQPNIRKQGRLKNEVHSFWHIKSAN